MSNMYKKTMKDLHLTERFLFAEAMEDPVIGKNMLEIIMEKSIHLLSRIETEKELRSSEFLRSVRLDMFALDDEDNVYNAEMQKVKEGDLVRRSRYYQAMIDHSLLIPGEKEFGDLTSSRKYPTSLPTRHKWWVRGDLLVSGGVRAPSDKPRSGYEVTRK